ncbi:MAG: hypothetical protein MRZ79_10835 [Bacteroidia bacterium]|nr:hypothetical protein [Bacteroidia bacterium]
MSKPLLKIGPLTSLQDARSSAAVGFDLVTFSLERGSMQKLATNMIWSIVQWLSGPRVVLEINRFSLEELEQTKDVFTYEYLSFPLEEWGTDLLELEGKLIFRLDSTTSTDDIQSIVEKSPAEKVYFEISVDKEEELQKFGNLLQYAFIHDRGAGKKPLELNDILGFSMKQEMEEEAGVLNYEAIDEWLEVFQEEFVED